MDDFPSRERTASVAAEPRVSAIVLVRDQGSIPRQSPLDLCLRSALAEPTVDDLVIVDQRNADEVSAALRSLQADRRDVTVVAAPAAATYAAAANLGAHAARGRWLLFLDPNVVLQRGAVGRLAAAGDEAHRPCIVGGRLTDLGGRERHAVRAGALTAFSAIALAVDLPAPRPFRRKRAQRETPARVAAVSGALMAIPRRDFQALGGFHEEFKTDCADLDLCWRAAAAGGAVFYEPGAAGVQFGGSDKRRKRAQGLARFAARSARTAPEKLFAAVAEPALAVLLALKQLVLGERLNRP